MPPVKHAKWPESNTLTVLRDQQVHALSSQNAHGGSSSHDLHICLGTSAFRNGGKINVWCQIHSVKSKLIKWNKWWSLEIKLQCGCIIRQRCAFFPAENCIPSFVRSGDCYMYEIHTVEPNCIIVCLSWDKMAQMSNINLFFIHYTFLHWQFQVLVILYDSIPHCLPCWLQQPWEKCGFALTDCSVEWRAYLKELLFVSLERRSVYALSI